MSTFIQLRRYDTSTPWGFRMNGGLEFGQPLYIQKVTANSPSQKAGLCPGDVILQIGPQPSQGMSHQQAKMEIIRAGNDVDFVVQRNGYPVAQSGDQPDSSAAHQANSHHGYSSATGTHLQDPRVQSRSFKMLQHELHTE